MVQYQHNFKIGEHHPSTIVRSEKGKLFKTDPLSLSFYFHQIFKKVMPTCSPVPGFFPSDASPAIQKFCVTI